MARRQAAGRSACGHTDSTPSASAVANGVDDGDRTHDIRSHNPVLYQLSYAHHRTRVPLPHHIRLGAPGRIRTCYPRLRRPMLYPDELQALRPSSDRARRLHPILGASRYRGLVCELSLLMVGAEGFEPPTPCSQSRCATRLRYAPTVSPNR